MQALHAHTSAMVLTDAIDKTTTDVKALPVPISEADGQSLLTAIETLTPIIIDTLDNMVAKKPTVNALPFSIPAIVSIIPISVPALVKQDLVKVNASALALEDAFLEAAPADFVPTGFDLKSQVDTAFARAIATYT